MLVVAVPDTAVTAPLDVNLEVAALTELLPGWGTVRRSTGATRDQVLADLPRHSHAHFAWHGAADTYSPRHRASCCTTSGRRSPTCPD